jgi:ABC-2 type transport system ATP-binding protein
VQSGLAIQTFELAKAYGSIVALRGLTMSVRRGEAFGFLGPNGAGKTTAVKMLLGLTRPTTGDATVLGAPLGDLGARRRLGYLPELFRYQDWLSAREVLGLHCALAGIARDRRPREVDVALRTVGLAARADDRVATFSKGMQQRLGLGVALLGSPDIVFLDEPTSALDPVGRQEVRAIIEALKSRGTAVFLNSHLLTEVERVCDRIAILDRGRIVAAGSIDDVVGAASAVRMRLGDVGDEAGAVLRGAGATALVDGWYTVRGVAPDRVPSLVAALVRAGASVFAVEPARATLEDRFIELLRGPDAAADDRVADPA